jgi:hypothetical protein
MACAVPVNRLNSMAMRRAISLLFAAAILGIPAHAQLSKNMQDWMQRINS